MASNKQQIMKLLNWTEEQYGDFQLEQGMQYLHGVLLGGDDTWLNELSRSKIFWQWWINQWNMRDTFFIGRNYSPYCVADRVAYYRYLNSPCTLHCKPHKCVLQATYAVMMQDFIDETMKQAC